MHHRRKFPFQRNRSLTVGLLFTWFGLAAQAVLVDLDTLPAFGSAACQERNDWLIHPSDCQTAVFREGTRDIILSNGLLLRRWHVYPGFATTHVTLTANRENFVRGVKPEARLVLDGDTVNIGGLDGQPEYAYLLPEWLDAMTAPPDAFRLDAYDVEAVRPRLVWNQTRWSATTQYPTSGKRINFHFSHPAEKWSGIRVSVHYEMYDGIPLLSKWISVQTEGRPPLRIDHFTSEMLAVREEESSVDHGEGLMTPNILVQSDYAFHDMSSRFSNKTVHWMPDPQYSSQVNYLRQTPCLLQVFPPIGPGIILSPGDTFQTFRVWELFHDSHDRERKGLAERRMYRTLTPWATENPIFMHLTSTDPAVIRSAIDQCAETGFEMVILSFGSGFDMEDTRPEHIARYKALADYAHSKGIQLGGYSLFSSRHIDDQNDCINPRTGQPGGAIFGNAPCLGSTWGIRYLDQLRTFLAKTGFDLLEHDGPYPGDLCASTKHPGHEGLADSQWQQWSLTDDFYRWLREKGIYLNAPDWYFLNGSNKTGIGYREVNWSLPRERQIILGRQNIYDGTWTKLPSMGWTFTPLVEYHGGGAAATLEPLSEHLDAYLAHLWQNFGAGVQSCYRGPRLYDGPVVKEAVIRVVQWYKKYRDILNADLLHLRRPDGQDWDGFLHVDSRLPVKGMAMLFNPTATAITRNIRLPLYYTGLRKQATLSLGFSDRTDQMFAESRIAQLDEQHGTDLEIQLPARGWVVVRIE
ncbi:MAG: hypothetical protein RLY31_2054 [Bacteroidota bacterium]